MLFVSHNMGAISRLCSRGVLLEQGKSKKIGNADEVVRHYLAAGRGSEKLDMVDLTSCEFRYGTQDVRFQWVQLRDSNQQASRQFSVGDDITVVFGMKSSGRYRQMAIAVRIHTSDGILLCHMVNGDSGFQIEHLRDQEALSVCIKDVRFYPDNYYVGLWVGSPTGHETYDLVEDCLSFEIIGGGKSTTRRLAGARLFLTPEWSVLSTQALS